MDFPKIKEVLIKIANVIQMLIHLASVILRMADMFWPLGLWQFIASCLAMGEVLAEKNKTYNIVKVAFGGLNVLLTLGSSLRPFGSAIYFSIGFLIVLNAIELFKVAGEFGKKLEDLQKNLP